MRDKLTHVQEPPLAFDLVLEGTPHRPKAVEILDLDLARGERISRSTERYVDVGAQAPLLQVAIVHAEIHQDLSESGEKLSRLFRCPNIRPADDLQQGHA